MERAGLVQMRLRALRSFRSCMISFSKWPKRSARARRSLAVNANFNCFLIMASSRSAWRIRRSISVKFGDKLVFTDSSVGMCSTWTNSERAFAYHPCITEADVPNTVLIAHCPDFTKWQRGWGTNSNALRRTGSSVPLLQLPVIAPPSLLLV